MSQILVGKVRLSGVHVVGVVLVLVGIIIVMYGFIIWVSMQGSGVIWWAFDVLLFHLLVNLGVSLLCFGVFLLLIVEFWKRRK